MRTYDFRNDCMSIIYNVKHESSSRARDSLNRGRYILLRYAHRRTAPTIIIIIAQYDSAQVTTVRVTAVLKYKLRDSEQSL